MKSFALLPLLAESSPIATLKPLGSGGFGSYNPRMKKILSQSVSFNSKEGKNSEEKFKVHINSKECSSDDRFFCEDEICGEWKCPAKRTEFSQCVLELTHPKKAHFNPAQTVKRSCQCHMNSMGFRLFTGCKWRSDKLQPRPSTTVAPTTTTTTPISTSTSTTTTSTSTTSTTTSTSTSTTTTTTSTTTSTTSTTTTSSTTAKLTTPRLLFDQELDEIENYEEEPEEDDNDDIPQISTDHDEIFIDEFARCGRDIPPLAHLTCNIFDSTRACSVTCPNVFETNTCECHNGYCFWNAPFSQFCYHYGHKEEISKGSLSSFEIRGAQYPDFPAPESRSKTSNDGVYVQAFDLFQQMQKMMYESGYFNIFN